jgi:hypothetical protein
MYIAARHAIYFAALSTEAIATFMFLPSWNIRIATNPYASPYRRFLNMCKLLGSIPSHQLQDAEITFLNNMQTPLPKHTRELQIIAIWNTKGRNCPNAYNNNWLKELAKKIPEAKWEFNDIHKIPTPLHLVLKRLPEGAD